MVQLAASRAPPFQRGLTCTTVTFDVDVLYISIRKGDLKGHHTHEAESPGPFTLQALSLVEKVEPVQLRFTLRLRDQRREYVNARWMSSLHGFLRGIEWIMLHSHLDYFQKPPLGDRPNTKPRDHGTPNAHNRCFIWFIVCEDLRE
jgi:hypothetical protein